MSATIEVQSGNVVSVEEDVSCANGCTRKESLSYAYPTGSPPAYPEMKPGQQMIEIEAPAEITLDLDARQINERLSDLMQNYRVDVATMKPGLVRKF